MGEGDFVKHRWLFRVEDAEGEDHYVDAEGKGTHAEEFFVGTAAEAYEEAGRRATAWENLPGNGWPMKVTYEGHGVVKEESDACDARR